MVFGTFDLFHPGHRSLLEQALRLGKVTVVVARSSNVLRIKGRKPKQSDQVRLDAVSKAFPQVHVILGDRKEFLAPLRQWKPTLLFLGYDQYLPPGVSEEDLP